MPKKSDIQRSAPLHATPVPKEEAPVVQAATKRVVYRGPAQQVCYPLADHGYSAILVPDAVYELPTEFADAVLRSNQHFQVAPAKVFSFGGRLREAPKPGEDSVTATPSEEENQ
jgi:hypothetical protein